MTCVEEPTLSVGGLTSAQCRENKPQTQASALKLITQVSSSGADTFREAQKRETESVFDEQECKRELMTCVEEPTLSVGGLTSARCHENKPQTQASALKLITQVS